MLSEDPLESLSIALKQVKELRTIGLISADFEQWHYRTKLAIRKLYGENSIHHAEFMQISYKTSVKGSPRDRRDAAFDRGIAKAILLLEGWLEDSDQTKLLSNKVDPLARLEKLLVRFALVARQLTRRYGDRPKFQINDEYDVQDLLHALLHLHFDDIRREDPVSTFAGGSSRIDFLLSRECIGIEVKKVRNKAEGSKLGSELSVDIARYKKHPNCRTLLCFIYDPETHLQNPRGLEGDLVSLSTNKFSVRAIVVS